MLVSLISRLVACSPRIVVDKQTDRRTDRQTHRTTTVTLAAHARRGLMKGTKVLTLGEGRGISYPHAILVYACAVLLLVGWSINFYTTRGRLPSC